MASRSTIVVQNQQPTNTAKLPSPGCLMHMLYGLHLLYGLDFTGTDFVLLLTRLVLNEQYPSKMPADQVPLACRLSAEVASRDTFGPSLGQLRPYITSYLDDLNTAIQQRALADVNNWLVCLHASYAESHHFECCTCPAWLPGSGQRACTTLFVQCCMCACLSSTSQQLRLQQCVSTQSPTI